MSPKPIPDRWLDYKACGDIIEGTRIICFKVPLRKEVHEKTSTEIWDIPTLLQRIPKLCAVVDLTNTDRYYNPNDFRKANILHKKIFMPGRVIPPERKVIEFMDTIDEFLGTNCVAVQVRRVRSGLSTADSVIGVHCTHGLNRTGYMVCRYMRDRLGMPGPESIKRFETARGYKIERPVYINDIIRTDSITQNKGKAPRYGRNRQSEIIDETPSKQSSIVSYGDQGFYKQGPLVPAFNERHFLRNSDERFGNSSYHRDRDLSTPFNNFRDHDINAPSSFKGPNSYSGPNSFRGPNNYSGSHNRPYKYSGPSNPSGPNNYNGPKNYSGSSNFSGPNNYKDSNNYSGPKSFRGTNQRHHNDRFGGSGRYKNDGNSDHIERNIENNWRSTRNSQTNNTNKYTWRNSNYGDRRPRNNSNQRRFDDTDDC